MEPVGLGALAAVGPECQLMMITYPDGTVVEALLVSRGDTTLRAAVPGDDELRVFSLMDGTWISENSELVEIEFAWQRGGNAHVPSESECVCPPELASRLIAMLVDGGEGAAAAEDRLFVFSAEGDQARIQSSRLHGRRVFASVRPGGTSSSALN